MAGRPTFACFCLGCCWCQPWRCLFLCGQMLGARRWLIQEPSIPLCLTAGTRWGRFGATRLVQGAVKSLETGDASSNGVYFQQEGEKGFLAINPAVFSKLKALFCFQVSLLCYREFCSLAFLGVLCLLFYFLFF